VHYLAEDRAAEGGDDQIVAGGDVPDGLRCRFVPGLISQSAEQGPAQSGIGKTQGEVVPAPGEATAVRNRVRHGKTGLLVVPAPESADGNPLFEERPRLCGAGTFDLAPLPRHREKTPGG